MPAVQRRLSIAAILLALACAGSDLVLPGEGEPATLEIVQGDSQSGRVGEPLAQPLLVRVLDSSGRPVGDVPVAVVIAQGEGEPDVVPDTATSDGEGMASFRIQLGTRIGRVAGEVRVPTAGGSRTISVPVAFTALSSTASGLAIVSGDGQSGPVGTALGEPLVVQATDAFGNPISGVTVSWTAQSGGTVTAASTVTDPDGQAAVTRVLGEAAGTQTTVAAAEGLAGSPLTFQHVASAGNAARVVAVSGDGQYGVVGTTLDAPLVVQVLDAEGNPVPGRDLTWVVLLGGGVATPVNTTTDDRGRATTTLTLGPEAGQNTVSAVVSGIGIANFVAGGVPDPRTVPSHIERSGGDGQSATVGTTLGEPLSVQVTSAAGTPVAGVQVAWATQNGGTVSASTTASGENGIAQVFRTLGTAPGSYGTTATVAGLSGSPVSFSAIAVAGAPSSLVLATQPTGEAVNGAPFSRQPVIQLRGPAGAPLARAGIAVTVALANGSGRLAGTLTRNTGGDGRVAFTGLGIEGAAGAYTLIFSATGFTAAVSDRIALANASTTTIILSDDPDPSNAGQAVTIRFRVSAPNASPRGTVSVTAGPASCSRALANGTGECTLVLPSAGSVSIAASFPGAPGFGASAARTDHVVRAPGPVATATTITSDQPDPSAVGQPVRVRVTVASSSGTPTGSVTVSAGVGNSCTAAVAAGGCALTFTSAGDRTITATYAGVDGFAGSSDTEAHSVNAPPPPPPAPSSTTTRILSDEPDPSNAGGTVTVSFSVTGSGGTPSGAVTVRVNTGESCTGSVADGRCAVDIVAPGNHTLTAAYAGDASFAGSSSEAVPHTVRVPATPILTVRRQPSGTAVVGRAFERQPEIQLEDGEGRDSKTAGVSVTASVETGPGPLLGAVTVTTDGNGRAQFADLALGAAGTTTLRFSAEGFTAVTSAPIEVARAAASITITSDRPDPSQPGQPVTIAFEVTSGGSRPDGQVTVSGEGGESCSASTAAGSCSITFAAAGQRTLTATYAGTDAVAPSTATEQHTVATPAPASTVTTIASHTPDPSTTGQAVSVAVTVTATAGTPPGTVTVTASTGESCSTDAPSGQCTLSFTSPGTRTLTAAYGGSSGFAASTSEPASQQVEAPNAAPVAGDDAASVLEGSPSPVLIPVLLNDTDADGDRLELTEVSDPPHGTATVTADRQIQYTPDPDYFGPDAFTYRLSDGQALSAPATVSITVTAVNDQPTFTLSGDVSSSAAAGAVTTPGFASQITAGPAEGDQTVTFTVSIRDEDQPLFSVPPAIDGAGTLTFAPSGAEGAAVVAVVARDDGGTADGGRDASDPQVFGISLTP